MKKFIIAIILVCSLFSITASAYSYAPYNSYEYNPFDEAVNAPVGYSVSNIVDSSSLGLEKAMNSLKDIVVKDQKVYILDSGNGRIIQLNKEMKLEKTVEYLMISAELSEKYGVSHTDGKVTFSGAQGLDIADDGTLYIADTTNNRVLIADNKGNIISVILRPDEALNDTDAAFSPSCIEVDDSGWVYVGSESITLGVMVFDENHDFREFYGANRVLSTTETIVNFFREAFLTVTQLEFVEQNVPSAIYGMDFNDKGFLYTVSPYPDHSVKVAVPGLVKKFNYGDEDILEQTLVFGDLEEGEIKTWFHDVNIDDQGFINLMDTDRGRIFQYTDDGILVNVFGTKGDQIGCFEWPEAVENLGEKVLVVDGKKNCMFIFEPTEYGKTVRNAVLLMQNNDLDGSEKIWNDLLKQNSNSMLCYKGLGRISEYKGDYSSAMSYYKKAYAQDEYAQAFKEQRQIWIENNIIYIVLGIAVILAVIIIISKYLKHFSVVKVGAYSKMEQKYTIEFYALRHPIDAFSQFKQRNIGSYRVSIIILIIWFAAKILEYNVTGFAFHINRESDFNLLITVIVTFGIFVVFVITNWAVCTLLDGKGTLRDITATTAYSLIPFVVTRIIMVLMTNVFVPEESVFIQIVSVIGILWTAAILILGIMSIHEYSVGKTLFTMMLTLIVMALTVFLIVLIISLVQQMINFFISVYREIDFRI